MLEGHHLLDALLAAHERTLGRSPAPAAHFFLVTGAVAERLEGDGRLERLMSIGAEGAVIGERDLSSISDTDAPQGVLVVIERPEHDVPVDARRVLFADSIADPGNFGTLVRSAAAFGFDAVAASGGVDAHAPKVLRASAGASFLLPVHTCAEPAIWLDGCRARNVDVVAAVARGGEAPAPTPTPFVLVVGSEAHGIRAEVRERANRLVTVPLAAGVESLNAAVAGSILMHAMGGV